MYQYDGLTFALIHEVHLKAIVVVVVRCKGKGAVKRFVFNNYQVLPLPSYFCNALWL